MVVRLKAIVARLVGCSLAGVQVELRASLEHQSNRLYEAWADGRHLVVKEYLKLEEFSTGPIHEHRALELLAPLDVAPRPVGIEEEHDPDGGPLVVYEYLDGEMWGRRKPSSEELRALAEVWLKVDSVSAQVDWEARGTNHTVAARYARFDTRMRAFRAWTEAVFPSGGPAALRSLGVLDRRWPEVRELDWCSGQGIRRSFNSADERFANVIRRPDGRIGLVDWEDGGLGDPARDVTGLLLHPDQEDLVSAEEWRAFLEPYLAAMVPRDRLLPRRIELYEAISPMFWLSVLFQEGLRRAEAGTLAGWTVNGLPPNVRLRRYLARALAWPDGDFEAELVGLGDMVFFPTEP
jgi:aminoglycoside phosphotransferase (APT) family kinase protein